MLKRKRVFALSLIAGLVLIAGIGAFRSRNFQSYGDSCPAPPLDTSKWKIIRTDGVTFKLPRRYIGIPDKGWGMHGPISRFDADKADFVYYSGGYTFYPPDEGAGKADNTQIERITCSTEHYTLKVWTFRPKQGSAYYVYAEWHHKLVFDKEGNAYSTGRPDFYVFASGWNKLAQDVALSAIYTLQAK